MPLSWDEIKSRALNFPRECKAFLSHQGNEAESFKRIRGVMRRKFVS